MIMTNRKTLIKTAIAGMLAIGTLAGGANMAQANNFSFSWSTPQGTFTLGPNGHHFQPRHHQPRHFSRATFSVNSFAARQARRILRQAGFRDISFLRERPRVYVFEARGQRGYRRIAVNKFNGNIIWRWGRG
jgi:hypothetical protein